MPQSCDSGDTLSSSYIGPCSEKDLHSALSLLPKGATVQSGSRCRHQNIDRSITQKCNRHLWAELSFSTLMLPVYYQPWHHWYDRCGTRARYPLNTNYRTPFPRLGQTGAIITSTDSVRFISSTTVYQRKDMCHFYWPSLGHVLLLLIEGDFAMARLQMVHLWYFFFFSLLWLKDQDPSWKVSI